MGIFSFLPSSPAASKTTTHLTAASLYDTPNARGRKVPPKDIRGESFGYYDAHLKLQVMFREN